MANTHSGVITPKKYLIITPKNSMAQYRKSHLWFRGKNEQFEQNKDRNFMMYLKFFERFDHFLSNYITIFENLSRSRTFYLSSTFCVEFISLIGKK